jgi:methylmalonyl-CoA epimerase
MGKIRRIDHIAIAVENLAEASEILQTNLGAIFLRQIENNQEKYIVSYFQVGENVFTLLQPTSEESFIAEHIRQRGQGLHHLGLEVEGLEEFVAELEVKGVRIPVKDMGNAERKEAIISPRDVFGVLLQLVEWLDNDGISLEERMERVVRFRSPQP